MTTKAASPRATIGKKIETGHDAYSLAELRSFLTPQLQRDLEQGGRRRLSAGGGVVEATLQCPKKGKSRDP